MDKDKGVKINVGDRVALPLNEEGVVEEINDVTIDWFKYKVKITKKNQLFTDRIGIIKEYKKEQLCLIQ